MGPLSSNIQTKQLGLTGFAKNIKRNYENGQQVNGIWKFEMKTRKKH